MTKANKSEQLDLGFSMEALHTPQTPLVVPAAQKEREPANWYDVHTKAAKFLVRASHEFFVPYRLIAHLNEPVNPHTVQSHETKASLFGIELNEFLDELDVQAVSDKQSAWYDGTQPEDVVLISMKA